MSLPINEFLVPETPAPIAAEAPSRAAAVATTRHRFDIDGLRALAVTAVILTHAGISGFSGGFIGVDVFFVISGYLIYRDLVTRTLDGRLSLLGFYGRRMRRTLPALYVVAAVTAGVAAFVLMPGDLDAMARSLIATVLLVPNIFFFTETGYFDAGAASKPLLHSWSLGVEEQFYLVAPLLPLLLRGRDARLRRLVLFGLFLISLVGTVLLRHLSPDAAFYLMPARVFEFLVGAMLVEGILPPLRNAFLAEAATLLSLIAIGGSVVLFGDGVPHPGLATLIPCTATGLLIHVGSTRTTAVGALLGLRPIAFIGLISYSLYLWHWPMLVLARYVDVPETTSTLLIGAGALIALSTLSWRWVETPFRRPESLWRERAPMMLPLGAVTLLIGCIAIIGMRGLPGRFPPDVASVAGYYAFRDQKPFREGQCFITSKDSASAYDRGTCLKMEAGKPNVLLIGDSHAAHLWTALRDTWPNVNFLQATASGCKPVVGTVGSSRCTNMMHEMFDDFIPNHRLDAVVFGGLWDDDDLTPLASTIGTLQKEVGKVVVFGPMPRYDTPAATLIAKAMMRQDLDPVQTHLLTSVAPLDAEMRTRLSPSATYVSPYEVICPNGHCRLFAAPGVPIQFDYHHLTPLGGDLMMTAVKAKQPGLFEAYRSTSNR